jgi:site-specific DNA-methyltransferase (cytosine-N4-specific)
MNKVYWGDCRESLRQMKEEGIKVQMCVTSPPYYGLRDYGTGTWIGGKQDCQHEKISISNNRNFIEEGGRGSNKKSISFGDCIHCGAERKDLQIGLEETPQQFINNLVEVFAGVWDILADNGTLWVNLGDSYAGSNGNGQHEQSFGQSKYTPFESPTSGKKLGIKPKNLLGMPWRLAFALQDFGWYLRQDIIWHKPNPMPESVKDRCTKSHEYIFLLSKKPHYYFDHKAIQEPSIYGADDRAGRNDSRRDTGMNHIAPKKDKRTGEGRIAYEGKRTDNNTSGGQESFVHIEEMRNKRDVWTVNTKPYSGSHFAVFPTELIEPCILAGSRVGDIVLDPFFGSGTTGQVSQALGRKWIGCELNKNYESLQNERVSQQGLELI